MVRHWDETWGDDYPHREVTEAIIMAAIRIQKALGPGLLEGVYRTCLAHALRQVGRKALQEVHLDLAFEGLCLPNAFAMDLIVDDRVVVEAKTVERLADAHFAQLNSYLHFSGMEVGLLLNFRAWPLKDGGIRRIVRTRP